MGKKNVAMSVRGRLLNIRNSEPGTEYMQILLRYIQERMLYRLSMSQYRDNFCLKGSALLFAYEKFKARPTKDIDFLGDKISRDKETIRKAFSLMRSFRFSITGERVMMTIIRSSTANSRMIQSSRHNGRLFLKR